MEHLQFYKNNFLISTDPTLVDIGNVHHYLSEESYWAANIPIEVVRKSVAGSFCFSTYNNDKQVGFARVITDYATFGYLCDVFIDVAYRGRGLSKWLMEVVHNHPR